MIEIVGEYRKLSIKMPMPNHLDKRNFSEKYLVIPSKSILDFSIKTKKCKRFN